MKIPLSGTKTKTEKSACAPQNTECTADREKIIWQKGRKAAKGLHSQKYRDI